MIPELEEALMSIVGGFDIHRRQITFDYADTDTGEIQRGKIAPTDREHVRQWLARFDGRDDVACALEGCSGWRFVVEELHRSGVEAHLAEPADTATLRGRKKRAMTDRADARLQRELLTTGRLPESWIPSDHVLEVRAQVRPLQGPGRRTQRVDAAGPCHLVPPRRTRSGRPGQHRRPRLSRRS